MQKGNLFKIVICVACLVGGALFGFLIEFTELIKQSEPVKCPLPPEININKNNEINNNIINNEKQWKNDILGDDYINNQEEQEVVNNIINNNINNNNNININIENINNEQNKNNENKLNFCENEILTYEQSERKSTHQYNTVEPGPQLSTSGTRWKETYWVDRQAILDKFLPDLAPIPGPDKSLLIRNFNSRKNEQSENSKSSMDLLAECKRTEVLFVGNREPDRCIAIIEASSDAVPYHVISSQSTNLEDAGDMQGKWKHIGRLEGTGATEVYADDELINIHETLLRTYLFQKKMIKGKLVKGINDLKITQKNNIVILVINEDIIEYFLNFMSSLKANNINPLPPIVVVPLDDNSKKITKLFSSSIFVFDEFFDIILPDKNNIDDSIKNSNHLNPKSFSLVSWTRFTLLHTLVHSGYATLMIDPDQIWYDNPLSSSNDQNFRHSIRKNENNYGKGFEVIAMDIGSRDQRFAPIYADLGFIYIAKSQLAQLLVQEFLSVWDLMVAWKSQEIITNQLIAEHAVRFASSIKILDNKLYANGQYFKIDDNYANNIKSSNMKPKVLRTSWANTKDDKINMLKQVDGWYLGNDCILNNIIQKNNLNELSQICYNKLTEY